MIRPDALRHVPAFIRFLFRFRPTFVRLFNLICLDELNGDLIPNLEVTPKPFDVFMTEDH